MKRFSNRQDNSKQSNICVIRIPEIGERAGKKKIYLKINNGQFILLKFVEKYQFTSKSLMNLKQDKDREQISIPWSNCLNQKYRQHLKNSQGQKIHYMLEKDRKLPMFFKNNVSQEKKKCNDILKVVRREREKKTTLSIQNSTSKEITFKNESKIKTFSEQKLKGFVINRSALLEILKFFK